MGTQLFPTERGTAATPYISAYVYYRFIIALTLSFTDCNFFHVTTETFRFSLKTIQYSLNLHLL